MVVLALPFQLCGILLVLYLMQHCKTNIIRAERFKLKPLNSLEEHISAYRLQAAPGWAACLPHHTSEYFNHQGESSIITYKGKYLSKWIPRDFPRWKGAMLQGSKIAQHHFAVQAGADEEQNVMGNEKKRH